MEILMFLFLALAGLVIYAVITRKQRCMVYEGRLKPWASAFHAFLMLFLVIAPLFSIGAAVLAIVMEQYLVAVKPALMTIVFVGVGVCYFIMHLRKLATLVPEESVAITLRDQFLIGIGTVYYTAFCIAFFWMAIFGVQLFDFDFD